MQAMLEEDKRWRSVMNVGCLILVMYVIVVGFYWYLSGAFSVITHGIETSA
jgi:hypothetical protein